MSDDRRTKAQLIAELAQAKEDLSYARIGAGERKRPAAVPETDALADCIRAIDGLPRIKSNPGYATYTYVARGQYGHEAGSVDRGSVRRILAHLADKYGVAAAGDSGAAL